MSNKSATEIIMSDQILSSSASSSPEISPESSPSPQTVKSMAPYLISLIGTIAEYYDYALYGFCAIILSQYFFSGSAKALLSTYGLFALAAMGKPVGSVVFGWLGDRFGRSFVLKRSMVGIAIPTMVIALTPGQHEWGILSAIIIVICRFMQGVFVSGETDGVRIYLYESPVGRYPFFANSLVILSMIIGAFLASYGATYSLNHTGSWLWRIPFIIGGLLGIVVYYARKHLIDPPRKRRIYSQQKTSHNLRGIIATILLMGGAGGTYHLFFVFRPTFLAQISGTILPGEAQWTTTVALFFFAPGVLFSGYIAEKVGGKRVVAAGCLSLLTLSIIFMDEIIQSLTNYYLIGAFGCTIGLIFSPAFVLVMRQFEPEVRFRCASIGHSLGSLFLSGSAPFMATFFCTYFDTPRAFSVHLIILSLIVMTGLFLLRPAPIPVPEKV